jgi:hypothetical protein
MSLVNQNQPSPGFQNAWRAAGSHIQERGQGTINWIRASLDLPMLEHLSFRVGNQLFFIFVEAEEFIFEESRSLFLEVANEATAIPCIMPMLKQLSDYTTAHNGWGLIHAESKEEINPLELVTTV